MKLAGWLDRESGAFIDVRIKPIRPGNWIPLYMETNPNGRPLADELEAGSVTHQAPSASLEVKGGDIVGSVMFPPGLPDGVHNLYASPTVRYDTEPLPQVRRFRPITNGREFVGMREVGNPNGAGGQKVDYVLACDYDELAKQITEPVLRSR